MHTTHVPTPVADRIGSLDFLRGIAVLGILIINIETFSYPDSWSPFANGYHNNTDHWTRFVVYTLAQGKFFGMFALLFGAGFYMFLERLEAKGSGIKALDLYARRLIWLFIFGLIHAYLIWDGDILYHYAACGFFLFPFRSLNQKQLVLAIVLLVLVVGFNALENTMNLKERYSSYESALSVPEADRTEEETTAIDRWERRTSRGMPDTTRTGPVRNTVWESILTNTEHQEVNDGKVYYQGLFFRTLIMMMMGILLYRSGIFTSPARWRFYWPITLTFLLLALAQNAARYYQWTFEYDQPVMDYGKSLLFAFNKETLAVAYILFLNGIYHLFSRRLAGSMVCQAGRMALTIYIMQSILCGLLFYGYGLGMFNTLSRTQLLIPVVLIWVVQLLFSRWWLSRYKQGPLEALWRRLTYSL